MSNIQFGIVIVAVGSLYYNYWLYRRVKVLEFIKDDNHKYYSLNYQKMKKEKEILEKDKNKKIRELEEGSLNIKLRLEKLLDYKTKEYNNLEVRYEKEKKRVEEYFGRYYDQVNNTEEWFEKFMKKEEELYNLDWAYDELMKAYHSNALDLYFWNLLRSADRETRRKFIKSGKYRVCSLEDGRVMFEVI